MGTEVLRPQDCLRRSQSHQHVRRQEGRKRREGCAGPHYEVKVDTVAYAGTAFSMSPSPRALPVPTFFSKREEGAEVIDYLATRDLRRLLRLD